MILSVWTMQSIFLSRAVQVYSYWVLSMWTSDTVTVTISFAMSPSEVTRCYSEWVTSVLSPNSVCFALIHCETHRKRGEDFLKIKKLLTNYRENEAKVLVYETAY